MAIYLKKKQLTIWNIFHFILHKFNWEKEFPLFWWLLYRNELWKFFFKKIESTVKLRIVNSDRVKKIAYREYEVLYVNNFAFRISELCMLCS